jgi:hypothetical protein
VTTQALGSGERDSSYEVSDTDVAAGSTLGAPRGVLVLKANGAVEKFYSVDAGAALIQGVNVRFWDERTGAPLQSLPGRFLFQPDRQEHVFDLGNGLRVTEQVFMFNPMLEAGENDDPLAYYYVTLENVTDVDASLCSLCTADMRGTTGDDVTVRYEPARHAFVAWNASQPQFARALSASRAPVSWETTFDHDKCSRVEFPGTLSNRAHPGAPLALFHYRNTIAAGASATLTFVMAGTSKGTRRLRRTLADAPAAKVAAARTRAHYDAVLKRAVVVTPDSTVNRGVLWAKANMLRTQLKAPTGRCFVNDPTRSNNSVARDTAWFAYGADYVDSDFARESLMAYLQRLERKGLVSEYYDVRTGKASDYRLNINDDTPLLLLAVWHHFNTTGDLAFLRRAYPGARRAANYILAQRDDRGLVWCTSKGTWEEGIVGWRNVIENYTISGASTEVNSECYAALGAVAAMAKRLKKKADNVAFELARDELRTAINTHLIDPETGLYYLNIGTDGVYHTNVTCDMIFPVMFGVAERETAARVVSRLSMPDFWSAAGIHTVPRNDLEYGPTHGFGLLGGVWVGVTFWFAFAAARFNPSFMASALSDSFKHYSTDPRRNNTVPGQFSEWLHGETLVNQGMMLSPWFPPRYLWAAIEGAAGLDLSGDAPRVDPHLAPSWRWLGVRNLRLRGKAVSWFVVRLPELTMFANFDFQSDLEYHAYEKDVTEYLVDAVGSDMTVMALQRDGEIVIFVGNTADRTVVGPLRLRRGMRGTFAVRTFSSLRGEWSDEADMRASELVRGLPVQIDRHGFLVLRLRVRA